MLFDRFFIDIFITFFFVYSIMPQCALTYRKNNTSHIIEGDRPLFDLRVCCISGTSRCREIDLETMSADGTQKVHLRSSDKPYNLTPHLTVQIVDLPSNRRGIRSHGREVRLGYYFSSRDYYIQSPISHF